VAGLVGSPLLLLVSSPGGPNPNPDWKFTMLFDVLGCGFSPFSFGYVYVPTTTESHLLLNSNSQVQIRYTGRQGRLQWQVSKVEVLQPEPSGVPQVPHLCQDGTWVVSSYHHHNVISHHYHVSSSSSSPLAASWICLTHSFFLSGP